MLAPAAGDDGEGKGEHLSRDYRELSRFDFEGFGFLDDGLTLGGLFINLRRPADLLLRLRRTIRDRIVGRRLYPASFCSPNSGPKRFARRPSPFLTLSAVFP